MTDNFILLSLLNSPYHFFQVGKALFDGQLLDVHFTRSFYKHILEVKVTYQDIEAIDPDYYKNLKWMLEVCGSYMTFHLPLKFFCCLVYLLNELVSHNRSIFAQNDISDLLDLTFSIDADEEKLILYERTQVQVAVQF